MNDLQIFSNPDFGEVRVIEENGNIMFVASDIAKMLGYSRPADAIATHCKGSVKRRLLTKGGIQETKVIPEGDVYRLIVRSKLPSAEKFETWVFDEVLPAIRRTGTYTAQPAQPTDLQRQRLAIMERNSKSREASLWLKIAAGSSVPAYKDVANAYAANILAGKEVLPLPEATEQTYSATDIGRMLGVSAMKIGQLANEHGLKVAQYGKLFYDKSRYSNKQVETFRYYHCAVDRFRTLLGGEA